MPWIATPSPGPTTRTTLYDGSSFRAPMVKDSEWWAAPTEPISYDPDRAKAFIADYGQPVEFTLLVLAGNQVIEDINRASARRTKPGQGPDRDRADLGSYVGRVIGGDFDAAGWIGGSFGDPDSMTFTVLQTGSYPTTASSVTRTWTPPEAARSEADNAKRHELYDQIQQMFREKVPFLVGAHGSIYLLAHDNVGGYGSSVYFPTRTAGFTG
ncbi:MAG: hypothetical protein R2715_19670 [Ilumatobacteraceae bacterium]